MRATSCFTVEAARLRLVVISRIDEPDAIPREMSSPLGQSERLRRAPTGRRNDPAMMR